MEIQGPLVVESDSVKSYRLRFLLNRRGRVLSFHKPGCEGIEADREWSKWAERWPNHCGSCQGSGIGSYYGGGEYDPPDIEPCEDCILPHSDEQSICPRCAKIFPKEDMAVENCAHCGWDSAEDYPDPAPYGGQEACSCHWADEDEYYAQLTEEDFDSEGSQRHYMNYAEHISDDELRRQGKILERDSGSQYSPCACGCRILVRRPCLRCGSDQHSHKDRFSCAAMSDGSRRYRGQPQCFRCKAYGHNQKICPLPAPEYPPRTCAYCGEAGHNARMCPTIPDDFEWPIPEYTEWDAEGKKAKRSIGESMCCENCWVVILKDTPSRRYCPECKILKRREASRKHEIKKRYGPDREKTLKYMREWKRRFYRANPEKLREVNAKYRAKWTQEQIEAHNARNKKYYQENKERLRARARELYREKNAESADFDPTIAKNWPFIQSFDYDHWNQSPEESIPFGYPIKILNSWDDLEQSDIGNRYAWFYINFPLTVYRGSLKRPMKGSYRDADDKLVKLQGIDYEGYLEHEYLEASKYHTMGYTNVIATSPYLSEALSYARLDYDFTEEGEGGNEPSELYSFDIQDYVVTFPRGSFTVRGHEDKPVVMVAGGILIDDTTLLWNVDEDSSWYEAEGTDEPPHTRAIAGVSDSVAKFANANDTDDPAYAFGGFVAGFVLMPLVGTLISGWLMSKLKKRNLIPWEKDDSEQG